MAPVITIDNQMDNCVLSLVAVHYDEHQLMKVEATEKMPLKLGLQKIMLADTVRELCVKKYDNELGYERVIGVSKSNYILTSPPFSYTFTTDGELLEGIGDLKKQIRIYNEMNTALYCTLWLVGWDAVYKLDKDEAHRIFLKPGLQTISILPHQEMLATSSIKESKWSSRCKYPAEGTQLTGHRVLPSVYSQYLLTKQGELIEKELLTEHDEETSDLKIPEMEFRNNASFPIFLEGTFSGFQDPNTRNRWPESFIIITVDKAQAFFNDTGSIANTNEHFWGPFSIHEAVPIGPRSWALGKQLAHGIADRTTKYITYSEQEGLKIEPPHEATGKTEEPTITISLDNQLEDAPCGVILFCKDTNEDIPCTSQMFVISVKPGVQEISLSKDVYHLRIAKMLCTSNDKEIQWSDTHMVLAPPFSYIISSSGELTENNTVNKITANVKMLWRLKWNIVGTAAVFFALNKLLNHLSGTTMVLIPVNAAAPSA